MKHCGVYTRKSSEEGLEQEHNSLHAQREACEAYIRSQQHEGWRLVPAPYDDGGVSGGTMVRSALQALLAEVRAGRVDVIVVYKVDRLTRSLADFAKMVELFDAVGASFVAVTQQFNTTTSMGRLTLNVLLSFAQFEREVTGERIRDKIAASKRKRMWMGGRTPLGYIVCDRKLVVDSDAAVRVVQLYRRYLQLGSVPALKAELDAQGIMSKQGGTTPFSRGALYALLSNPIYVGQVRHRAECHPGQHEGIMPEPLYTAVQERLAQGNNGGPNTGAKHRHSEPSLLAGKLFDAAGERLTPTHARKGDRRYRYYVSASLLVGRIPSEQSADPHRADQAKALAALSSSNRAPNDATSSALQARAHGRQSADQTGWRVPAQDIEQNVVRAMLALLEDEATMVSAAMAAGMPAQEVPSLRAELASI